MPAVATQAQMQHARRVREILATYAASEDLVRVGAYQKGSDATLDHALAALPAINDFCRQSPSDQCTFEDSLQRLHALPVSA
jgi:flagellum-specific ATP synthase